MRFSHSICDNIGIDAFFANEVRMMKLGQFLDLEIKDPITLELRTFRSKIIDKDEDFIYITYPVEKRQGKTTYFPPGTHFRISYVGSDEIIYQFSGEIQNKRKKPIPALGIAIPANDELKQIQRRKFARVKIVADVAVHADDHSFPPFTTVTTDFSGGGLAFIIPENNEIHETPVSLWLALKFQQKMNYLKISGDIVRVTDDGENHIRTASVAFKHLTRKEEQTIIGFCFEQQRIARRKELT